MKQDEFVTRKEHQYALAAQLGLTQQLMTMVSALSTVLLRGGIVTEASWASAVDQAGLNEQAQKVREAIERMKGNESIQDILKDFEGPLQ